MKKIVALFLSVLLVLSVSVLFVSAEEAKDSESYKGFVALVRRMNKYRHEALAAFANPSKAKRKRDIAEVFATLEHALQDNTLTEKIEGESKND